MNEANVFDDYARWTDSVAKYPPTAEPFYLALGIAEEVAELGLATTKSDVLKEAGDVLWYCARYCVRVLDVPFSEAIESSISESGEPMNAITCVGAICGIEKKRIRDGELWTHQVKTDKHQDAWDALVSIIRFLNVYLLLQGDTLGSAITANMEKLTSRLDAGTIRGDGDNR